MTEQDIETLVPQFYAAVRKDPLLGPLFNRAVADWPEHLDKLAAFWSSVMLTSGRYKGSPMAAHLRHATQIDPAMFDRWLELWREAAARHLAPTDAAAIIGKAERIAESLKLSLYFRIEPRPQAA